MDFRSIFERVLTEYPDAKNAPLKDHPLAAQIRKEWPEQITAWLEEQWPEEARPAHEHEQEEEHRDDAAESPRSTAFSFLR